jgi:hypothetical protein
MAAYTPVKITEGSGTDIGPNLTAVNSSDSYAWGSKRVLIVNNGSGGTLNVTITPNNQTVNVAGYGELTKDSINYSVGDGETAIIDTRSVAYQGTISVSYDATSSVTAGVFDFEAL